jgi:hypothetical protein
VPDGTGGFFIVTLDESGGFSFPISEALDVHLIHLDAELRPIPIGDLYHAADPCGIVMAGGRGVQTVSSAAPFGADGVLTVGVDAGFPTDGDPPRVYAQAIDASGHRLLGDVPLHPASPDVPSDLPILALDGNGGFLLGWHERPQGAVAVGALLVRRFDGRSGLDTVIAGDGAAGAYIIWSEWSDAAGDVGFRHRIQHVDRLGTALWGAGGRRLAESGSTGEEVALASARSEGAIVVYAREGLRAQEFDGDGSPVWGLDGVLLSDPSLGGVPSHPLLSEIGEILYVTWLEIYDGSRISILVRRLDRDGTSPWPQPVAVLAAGEGFPPRRRQAVLSDGSLAVVWEDTRIWRIDNPSDTYAQTIDMRGRTKGPPDGVPISVVSGRESAPFVTAIDSDAAIGSGAPSPTRPQAFFIWSDTRLESLAPGASTSFFLQRGAFFSAPRLEPVETARLQQGASANLLLHGDDLQEGIAVDLGPGVDIEALGVIQEDPDGPGDMLTLQVQALPAAEIGPRTATLTNPDGGVLVAPDILSIELNPNRIDIDGSGRVDGFDLALFAHAFGRSTGDVEYLAGADIDTSGLVDGADLALLASRFGRAPVEGGAAGFAESF